MNLRRFKCSKFTKNSYLEIKCEINGKKKHLYSYCIDCGFEPFGTTD